jgi:hypothetical protein
MSEPDWSGYSDVLDNREYDVAERANALAPEAETVRIAVGYFYLGGFDLLKDNLRRAERVEILIGTDTDQRTIDELEQGFADDLEEYDRSEAQEGINRLYELIQEEKVDVRVYDDSRFHPKLYLFEHPAGSPDLGRAIIGSSNLSASGLRGNVELNVEKKDNNTIRYLGEWFADIWEEASEFDTDLMSAEIEKSQFGDDLPDTSEEEGETSVAEVEIISPFEATKRFIIEQYPGEVRNGTLLKEITGDYNEQVTEFNQEAFEAAKRPLNRYNGVILADSVGLGKSYVGAPLVQKYTSSRDEVLIIAPKRLEPMWMGELLEAESGVFSTEANKIFLSFAELSMLSEQEIQRLRSVDMILIDEAHKLRNTQTQRYAKLQSIGRVGNSVRDVDNLIKVFADDADFDIELDGQPPSEIFREYDRLSSDEGRSEADRGRLEELQALIESIMREVMISRDRKHIVENYDDITIGDRPIKVPERKPRTVAPEDPHHDELYSEIVDTVIGTEDSDDGGLNIPYISAERYDADGDTEKELIIEYQNASILVLINLLKRLESSLAAFEESVDRLIQRERITRDLAMGGYEDEQALEDAADWVQDAMQDDFGYEVVVEDVAEALERVSPSKRKEIVADIDADLVELQRIRERARRTLQIKDDGRTKDAKAERLRELINEELSGEKVLIFSQFIPTVTHLFEQLTGADSDQHKVASLGQSDSGPTVGLVYGGSGYDETIVDRFAPESQDAEVPIGEEIDILLATDVLGVGQNLQDARVLVNYDLNWNPMKMEQRIGRIDRITTRHDELLIYNFVPTGDLDRQLGLVERIRDKIEDIADTFGQAAPILDMAEERVHKTFMSYRDAKDGKVDYGDEQMSGTQGNDLALRSAIKSFCKDNEVSIEELQEAQRAITTAPTPQYFALPGQGQYITLTHLEHSSGTRELRTTIFDAERVGSTSIQGQTVIANFPRLETNEVNVFETIASSDDSRPEVPRAALQELQAFINELQSPDTWQNNILSRATKDRDIITKVRQLCQEVAGANAAVGEEAEQINDIFDTFDLSDHIISEIRTIHRRRTHYGVEDTIRKLHYVLTQRYELSPPETVQEAQVVLGGRTVTFQSG